MKWITRVALTLAVLMVLSASCSAADDREVCTSTTVSVDRIVEACTRVISNNPGDLPVIMRLGNILREGKDFRGCAEVYSKGIAAIAQPNNQAWAIFYFRGICYDRTGQWDRAEVDLRKALELDPDEPQVLNYLGYSWIDRSINVEEAFRMLQRAVEQQPNDGYIVDSLGWAYYRSGNYEVALKILERAARLKPDDPTINDHLGDLYAKLGRRSEARDQWIRARILKPEPEDLKKIEEKLASILADPNAVSSPSAGTNSDVCKPGSLPIDATARQANVQNIHYRYQLLIGAADYAAALAEAQKLEVAARAQYGTKHYNYAYALLDLAQVCVALFASYEASEALYKRAAAIFEKFPTRNRQEQVFGALTELANMYGEQGRYAEGAEIEKRALSFWEKSLGPDDEYVAGLRGNLATSYTNLGKYVEAERLYKSALPIMEEKSGVNSWSVGLVLERLGILYFLQGRYAEAEDLYHRAQVIFEKRFDASHVYTGEILQYLGQAQTAQGHYSDAEMLYQRAMAIYERRANAQWVADVVMYLGSLYEQQGKHADAERQLRRALAVYSVNPSTLSHPNMAQILNDLGLAVGAQGRYSESEPLLKRALTIREQALGTSHPDTAVTLNVLAGLYGASGDDKTALAYSRRATAAVIADAVNQATSPGQLDERGRLVEPRGGYFERHVANLAIADRKGLEPSSALKDEALEIAQWAVRSSAAAAVQQMGLRFASGHDALAAVVRERQDLSDMARAGDKALVKALSKPEGQRSQVLIENIRRQIADTESKLTAVVARLEREFPDYAALAIPKPLQAKEVQNQLGAGEALVLFLDTSEQTFIWVVTKGDMRWVKSELGTKALTERVAALRCGLDAALWDDEGAAVRCRTLVKGAPERDVLGNVRAETLPFDANRAYALYQALFAPVADITKDKHLLIVPSGALTQLPFQVLVTQKPDPALSGMEAFRRAQWLFRSHALTVLPSVSSLKALRQLAKESHARRALIGFGNPLLDGPDARYATLASAARSKTSCPELSRQRVAELAGSRRGVLPLSLRRGLADGGEIRSQVPLPETADELCAVARDLNVGGDDIRLGERATETEVKRLSEAGELAKYRIIHFATHGALAGQVSGNSEPGLILTPPNATTERDDGYLSASEITTLKLDADWVILSACNTAAGGAEGAEALSGLARAFFYAGARSLLVSHWAVASDATVKLITGAVGRIASDKEIGRAEAMRQSMIALIDRGETYEAHPAFWAPFIVVGEGAAR
jgi:CHAT domain-containing protein/tetratricopeptide (TPR) repeat protein